jgi:hypothetical protein
MKLKDAIIPENLLLKYLTLMCKLKPDQVHTTLKSFSFPLEEALKICEKYQNLHGMAFIKSRTNNVAGAIKIYMMVTLLLTLR